MRALVTAVLVTAFCVYGQAPDTQIKGLPPRATPADYQAQGQAGAVIIAAEFMGHSVPTPQGPLSTEDFVVVETGMFGTPDALVTLSSEDFSLRVNGKKTPLASQPYGVVIKSLRDPEWEPPTPAGSSSKSKTSLSGGGGDKGDSNNPPPPVHIPIEVQRAMQQRIQKASLPEGDRALPAAGLIFFQYSGKVQGIRSIELIYSGPAGKATIALRP